jgi:hypothetical protein
MVMLTFLSFTAVPRLRQAAPPSLRPATLPGLVWVAAFALLAARAAAAEAVQAWIIESPALDESIVATNPAEKDQLVKDGWMVDGTGLLRGAAEPGAGPLHRLARTKPGGVDRALETDVKRLPALKQSGFLLEGLLGYVADSDGPGRVAVVQYSKGDKRVWVVNPATEVKVSQQGWTRQGVHFWLWPLPAK